MSLEEMRRSPRVLYLPSYMRQPTRSFTAYPIVISRGPSRAATDVLVCSPERPETPVKALSLLWGERMCLRNTRTELCELLPGKLLRLKAYRDFVERTETLSSLNPTAQDYPTLSHPPKQARTIWDVAILHTSGIVAFATLDEPAESTIHHRPCKRDIITPRLRRYHSTGIISNNMEESHINLDEQGRQFCGLGFKPNPASHSMFANEQSASCQGQLGDSSGYPHFFYGTRESVQLIFVQAFWLEHNAFFRKQPRREKTPIQHPTGFRGVGRHYKINDISHKASTEVPEKEGPVRYCTSCKTNMKAQYPRYCVENFFWGEVCPPHLASYPPTYRDPIRSTLGFAGQSRAWKVQKMTISKGKRETKILAEIPVAPCRPNNVPVAYQEASFWNPKDDFSPLFLILTPIPPIYQDPKSRYLGT
ncbi:hypothetical protein C7212DRAFT_342019 [Tuber magnatum]|uniref:Uncharacterized protein n=1 Tax=Tuber magnatum TaxID=42249 RepID=A0A317T2B6_9PEZI|nr:hypothetical protein C7212DRAFT_342019 [Tuber magnatum]